MQAPYVFQGACAAVVQTMCDLTVVLYSSLQGLSSRPKGSSETCTVHMYTNRILYPKRIYQWKRAVPVPTLHNTHLQQLARPGTFAEVLYLTSHAETSCKDAVATPAAMIRAPVDAIFAHRPQKAVTGAHYARRWQQGALYHSQGSLLLPVSLDTEWQSRVLLDMTWIRL